MRKITAQEKDTAFHLDLGEYARILWRKKWFVLIPLVIGVLVSNVGVHLLVPEYEASTLIRIGNAAAVDTEVDKFIQTSASRRSRDEELGMQLEADINGSAFLDEFIRRMGMDRDPELIERAQEQQTLYPGISVDELVMRRLRAFLRKHIKVDREGPGLFRIAYADANPEACYVVADAVTKLYMEIQRRQTNQALQEVSQFSEEQLAVYKERLDRSERELARFQEQMTAQATSANPVTQGNVALSERLRSDLDLTIRSSEATLDRIRDPMTAQLGRVPDGGPIWSDAELKKLVSDLTNRREAELLKDLNPAAVSPVANDDIDGVAATQQAIQRRLATLVLDNFPKVTADYRPIVVEYFYQQAEIDALRQKRSKLAAYIQAFRSRIQMAPQMETELARLRQEVENNRTVYNTFANAARTTQIRSEAQNTELGRNVFLVEAASKPLEPVRPNKFKILALAFVLGITVGAAGLLLTEFTDSSFRSVEDVEKILGLKVLGTIPRYERTRWRHDSTRRRAVIWTVTVVVLVAAVISTFYFYGKSVREQMIDLNLSAQSAPAQPSTER